MTSTDTEHHIAMLVAKGDNRAARELYDAYAGYLTGVCARYLSDEDDLKDVVQESFINIITSFDKFTYSGNGSLKAWITKITVNKALHYLRDNKRLIFVQISEKEAEIKDTEPDVERLSQKEIVGLIRELPPGYRAVFNLHVFEEKSHKEIAKLLNIKENSSASQFHRAKAILASKINDYVKRKQGNYNER